MAPCKQFDKQLSQLINMYLKPHKHQHPAVAGYILEKEANRPAPYKTFCIKALIAPRMIADTDDMFSKTDFDNLGIHGAFTVRGDRIPTESRCTCLKKGNVCANAEHYVIFIQDSSVDTGIGC